MKQNYKNVVRCYDDIKVCYYQRVILTFRLARIIKGFGNVLVCYYQRVILLLGVETPQCFFFFGKMKHLNVRYFKGTSVETLEYRDSLQINKQIAMFRTF